jgi:hypothetical protein
MDVCFLSIYAILINFLIKENVDIVLLVLKSKIWTKTPYLYERSIVCEMGESYYSLSSCYYISNYLLISRLLLFATVFVAPKATIILES